MKNLTSKIVLITGGNAGIGKATALQMAELGWTVVIGARNEQRANEAVQSIQEKVPSAQVHWLDIDLSSQASIRNAAKQFVEKYQQLDALIHNAADFDLSRKKAVNSVDGIELIWATNHIGPILLTQMLLPALEKSEQGRIITVASQGLMLNPSLKVDLKDPEYKDKKFTVPAAYYQSKLAQLMYTFWLAEQLKDTHITANCIRVTNVKIDLSRYPNLSKFDRFLYSIKSKFSISPEEMAKTYVHLATAPALKKVSGRYFNEKNKFVDASPNSQDKKAIKALMELSFSYLLPTK